MTKEVYDLLSNNYVEDDDAMFRLVGPGQAEGSDLNLLFISDQRPAV